MDITISLTGQEPPTGTLVATSGTDIPFEGWLGLLQGLSEMLERDRGALEQGIAHRHRPPVTPP